MDQLVSKIEELKGSEVRDTIEGRLGDFKRAGRKGNDRWFSELCFCILTANCSAKLCIEIQKELGPEGFLELPLSDLQERLEELGHRFYRTRAEYIVGAREYSENIKDRIEGFLSQRDAREWLVENVKGIGYKEGSHFLRNVGYEDVMILDRHILRVLDREGVIDEIPNTLTENRYLKIETEVEDLAEEVKLSLAAIDLYIWYLDTGEILK